MEKELAKVTRLLQDASSGSRNAVDQLVPLVYDELRRIAAGQMRRERPGSTLQPTALVHEAYVKLINQRAVNWQNRAHFFAIAAQQMRRILLEHARARRAQKRGGGYLSIALDESLKLSADNADNIDDVIALDEALLALEALDSQQARIVELRFYVDLSVEETAEVLGIGSATVKRDWAMARAWLLRELATKRLRANTA
jgi:RNA polymerase sigma-70 factor, ECF subfamily